MPCTVLFSSQQEYWDLASGAICREGLVVALRGFCLGHAVSGGGVVALQGFLLGHAVLGGEVEAWSCSLPVTWPAAVLKLEPVTDSQHGLRFPALASGSSLWGWLRKSLESLEEQMPQRPSHGICCTGSFGAL